MRLMFARCSPSSDSGCRSLPATVRHAGENYRLAAEIALDAGLNALGYVGIDGAGEDELAVNPAFVPGLQQFENALAHVEHQAHFTHRRNRALQQHLDVVQLAPLPLIRR